MTSKEKDPFVLIGKIAGPQGLQGWLKIISNTRPRDSIGKYKFWQIRENAKADWLNMQVKGVKQQGKSIIALLDTVSDRTDAEKFMGWDIAIHEQQLPNLQENEYYWRDLIGLRVINHEGIDFGKVDHLIETGANDVLVVKDEKVERLIPYVHEQFIKEINLESGEMRVEWDADF